MGTQKAVEMGQVHYSRQVDDAQIENVIEGLPIGEIISVASG